MSKVTIEPGLIMQRRQFTEFCMFIFQKTTSGRSTR